MQHGRHESPAQAPVDVPPRATPWAKVISKHYTAFNRQVREGVIITKMAGKDDIIMNSKSEVVGTRIGRKKVILNGETLELVIGDISILEPQERKLISELEEGGEDYADKELWTRVMAGGKRKLNKVTSRGVTKTEVDQKPKRQRLIRDSQPKKGGEMLVEVHI